MISGAETASLSLRPGMPLVDGRLPTVQAQAAAALGLTDGQVVQAAVDDQSGTIRLQWQQAQQGRMVELQREAVQGLRLPGGDTALFRVQFLPTGAILLRPIPSGGPARPGSSTPASNEAPAERGSATASPRLPSLLARPPATVALSTLLQPQTLIDLARNLGSSDAQQALAEWLRARPSMGQLNGDRLARLIARSGWLTEAVLARGEKPEGPDLKSALRRVLDAEPMHPQAGSIAQALDEIEAQQVHSAVQQTGQEWTLSLMLPFADASPVSLRISREPPSSRDAADPKARAYYVQMHTQSQQLGELWLQSVHREQQVELTVWAAREDTAAQAQAMAGHLRGDLTDAGLEVGSLQVIHGVRPQSRPGRVQAEGPGRMLDVQT